MKRQTKTGLERRQFFRALGGAAAAAAAAAPLAPQARADEKRKARYRESDEVKTYYRVNRYPS